MVSLGQGPQILPVHDLVPRLKENARLLAAAAPVLKWLSAQAGQGFAIAVADRDLVLLEVASTGGACPPGVERGACWDSDVVGTTAAQFARNLNRPWLMRGDEHDWPHMANYATVAAPIDAGNGQPDGLLVAWGLNEAVHPHTLGMLGAAALAVGTQLREGESAARLQSLLKYQAAIVESVSDGLLTVDAEGIVTYMNPAAGRILGHDHKAAVGRPISALVGFRPVVLDVLRTGEGYTDKEFILRDSQRSFHFIKTAIPIRDESGRITGVVDTFREIQKVRQMVNRLTGAQARFTFDDFIGRSPAVQETLSLARVAARSSSNVLILGESGTGKEVLAQAIHSASPFAEGPFVAVNCGAIPRDLIEGELFGAEEGAFTGAPKGGRPGKFEMAQGGTIFLDEIGDMPLDMQVKLLRVLQERRVTRLGGKYEVDIRVRVIAATNHDLLRDVNEGSFRRDLYYRLNVLSVVIPPLHQRLDDLPLLVDWLLSRLNKKCDKAIAGITPEAMALLRRYSWPGNVRELENVLELAVNVAEGDLLTPGDIHLRGSVPEATPRLQPELRTISEVEVNAVRAALEACGGNVTRAARMLGCSRNTVYAKLRSGGREQPETLKN